METKDKVLDIISDVCCVAKSRLKLDIPLEDQLDIDSLDCSEIEVDIQYKLNLKFDLSSVVSKNLTPNQIILNTQKLVDKKVIDEVADKKAEQNIINRVRLF
jgi:acyl carrier protein